MSVHYKFKSALDFDTITFDGLHISVADLKKAIIHQKRLGKTMDFDLQITNAQTKEEYGDDSVLIPKNTSLTIARVPLKNAPKKNWEPKRSQDDQQSGQGSAASAAGSRKGQDAAAMQANVDLSTMNGTEEDKIREMMFQSTAEYDPTNYQRIRGQSQTGEVPVNYKCYRCHKPGHWIKNCPLGPLPKEAMEVVKRTSGIPRSFIERDKDPENNPIIQLPVQAAPEEKQVIPEDLICAICKDLFTDAVMIPCCGSSFCDECVRTALLESEDNECPDCKEKGSSPGSLIPNRFLRNSVNAFRNETGYTKAPPKVNNKQTKPVEEPVVAVVVEQPTVSSSTNVTEASPGEADVEEKSAKEQAEEDQQESTDQCNLHESYEEVSQHGDIGSPNGDDKAFDNDSDYEDGITVTVPPAHVQSRGASRLHYNGRSSHYPRHETPPTGGGYEYPRESYNSATSSSGGSRSERPEVNHEEGTGESRGPKPEDKEANYNVAPSGPPKHEYESRSPDYHQPSRGLIPLPTRGHPPQHPSMGGMPPHSGYMGAPHQGPPGPGYPGAPHPAPHPYPGGYGMQPGYPPQRPYDHPGMYHGERPPRMMYPPRGGYAPHPPHMRPRHMAPIGPGGYPGVPHVGTGVIDDPLEAFNRIMREKERRKEQEAAKQASRHRSSPHADRSRRSRSFEKSGSGNRSSHRSADRDRRRSPRPERRRSPEEKHGGEREREGGRRRRNRSSSYSSGSRSYSRSPAKRGKSPKRRSSRSPQYRERRSRSKSFDERRHSKHSKDRSREERRDDHRGDYRDNRDRSPGYGSHYSGYRGGRGGYRGGMRGRGGRGDGGYYPRGGYGGDRGHMHPQGPAPDQYGHPMGGGPGEYHHHDPSVGVAPHHHGVPTMGAGPGGHYAAAPQQAMAPGGPVGVGGPVPNRFPPRDGRDPYMGHPVKPDQMGYYEDPGRQVPMQPPPPQQQPAPSVEPPPPGFEEQDSWSGKQESEYRAPANVTAIKPTEEASYEYHNTPKSRDHERAHTPVLRPEQMESGGSKKKSRDDVGDHQRSREERRLRSKSPDRHDKDKSKRGDHDREKKRGDVSKRVAEKERHRDAEKEGRERDAKRKQRDSSEEEKKDKKKDKEKKKRKKEKEAEKKKHKKERKEKDKRSKEGKKERKTVEKEEADSSLQPATPKHSPRREDGEQEKEQQQVDTTQEYMNNELDDTLIIPERCNDLSKTASEGEDNSGREEPSSSHDQQEEQQHHHHQEQVDLGQEHNDLYSDIPEKYEGDQLEKSVLEGHLGDGEDADLVNSSGVAAEDHDEIKRSDSILDLHANLDFEGELEEGEHQSPPKFISIPELSKWELDEETPLITSTERRVSIVDEHNGAGGAKHEDTSSKVTNEVLKRAENAIFTRAINAIRPIEIKKISVDRQKLYANEAHERDADVLEIKSDKPQDELKRFTVTVPMHDDHAERSVEIKLDSRGSPVRGSIRERLGSKITDVRGGGSISRSRTPPQSGMRKVKSSTSVTPKQVDSSTSSSSRKRSRSKTPTDRDGSSRAGRPRADDRGGRGRGPGEEIKISSSSSGGTRRVDLGRRLVVQVREVTPDKRRGEGDRKEHRSRERVLKEASSSGGERSRDRVVRRSRERSRDKKMEREREREKDRKRDGKDGRADMRRKSPEKSSYGHKDEKRGDERKRAEGGEPERRRRERSPTVNRRSKEEDPGQRFVEALGRVVQEEVVPAKKSKSEKSIAKLVKPVSSSDSSSSDSDSSSSDSSSDSDDEAARKRKKRKHKKDRKRSKRSASTDSDDSGSKKKKKSKKSKSGKKKKKEKKHRKGE